MRSRTAPTTRSRPHPARRRELASARANQDLVRAALNGATDADLVAALATASQAAGLDIATIEVACDAVDPERDQHLLRWRRGRGTSEGRVLAFELFEHMLEHGQALLRLATTDARSAAVLQDGATDAVAFAIHLAPEATLGFFDDVMVAFVTDRPGGWRADEVDFLSRVTPSFALALGARLNAAAARVLLQTYLGGDAATALLGGRVSLGEVEQIRAVVIYCDLSDFTALTETLDARSLIDTLNLFFETITRPVAQAGGQISGHVGDAVVMFFPVRAADQEGPLCAAAIRAAVDGLAALDILNASERRRSAPPLRARIGIDIGEVVHGNIGSPGRFSFTIIGTPVNRAARLQALAKTLDTTVLMTARLGEVAAVPCRRFGTHRLRGFDQAVDIVGPALFTSETEI